MFTQDPLNTHKTMVSQWLQAHS